MCKQKQREAADEIEIDSSSSDSAIPAIGIRKELMYQWKRVHQYLLTRAFTYAVLENGGLRNFDYSSKVLNVDLKYRPESRLNPGKTFDVTHASFEAVDDLAGAKAGLRGALIAGQPQRSHQDSTFRSQHPDLYCGLLLVIYNIDNEYGEITPMPITAPLGGPYDVQPNPLWLPELQTKLHSGWVYRLVPGEHGVGQWCLGTLVKASGGGKKRWTWRRWSRQELMAVGLEPDHNLTV